nr:truncated transporter-related protein [Tanacetum cinerariifolium]
NCGKVWVEVVSGVSSLSSLVALLFYTLVPESPRFLYAKGELGETSKILNWGAELNKRQLPEVEVFRVNESKESTSDAVCFREGAQNEREVVASEEDEIKDVTLDIDKTVAGEMQIDEAHHTLKKDDPVDRAGPKVEQGNSKNEKEDETNENTKLIIRHNNTYEFFDITSVVESITQTSRAIFGILDDGDLRTKNVHAIMLGWGFIGTLGAGVAIVVGRIGSIVLPLVGEGMMSYDANKTPAMIMFAFKISVCMVCALLLPIETRGRVLKDDD